MPRRTERQKLRRHDQRKARLRREPITGYAKRMRGTPQ